MSIARNAKRQILGWQCPCNRKKVIPLIKKNCPLCSRAMPQADRTTIYRLVTLELRPIYLAPAGKRWSKFADTVQSQKILFRVILWLSIALCAAYLIFWMPDSAARLQSLLPPFVDMGKRLWDFVVNVVLTFRDLVINLIDRIRELLNNLR